MPDLILPPKVAEVDWRRGLVDPVYFASAVLDIDLHPGQARWLVRSNRPENLLVTGNRWGKSFVSAVKLIHRALYRPRPLSHDAAGRYRAVIVSITQDQANLVFNQVSRLINGSPLLSALVESRRQTPHPIVTFGNSASIEARSSQNRGEYLLGNDFDLVVFDEVAFESEPEYVVEEVLTMRLADREGMLDLVSTPNGKNWFYRRFRDHTQGNRKGYIQSGDSRDNPRLPRRFLDDRLKYFSDARVQQNIMGQFVDSGGEILMGRYIDQALSADATAPSLGPQPPRYISGWDLARKQTATVGITVAVTEASITVVQLERFKRFDWTVVIDRIRRRQYDYPGQLVIDATGLGDVVTEQLREFRPEAFVFSEASKAELLANLELLHALGRMCYHRWELPDGPGRIWSLEDELREARWDDNNQCDALMALALAVWPLRRRSNITPWPRLGRV